jgi:sporulation protein YabP
MPEPTPPTHTLTLEGRRHVEIVGVTHVETFTDDTIVLSTALGTLTIRGHSLKIQQLDLETTRFVADGDVDGFQYSRRRPAAGDENLWRRLWR